MKNYKALVVGVALIAIGGIAQATDPIGEKPVFIKNAYLGSGMPGNNGGFEEAVNVAKGIYFADQYLPGYPTAAVIFPRVIDVNCEEDAGIVKCEGYTWRPELGRGEYLFFRPNFPKNAAPTNEVTVTNVIIRKKVTE